MKKALNLAGLLIALSGCTSPTTPTPTQTEFILSGVVTQKHIDLAPMLWQEQQVCMNYLETPKEIHIEVMLGSFVCGSVMAAGCTIPGHIRVDGRFPTYTNALAHEYIHLIEGYRGHAPDYAHTGPSWAKCDTRNR